MQLNQRDSIQIKIGIANQMQRYDDLIQYIKILLKISEKKHLEIQNQ